MSFRLFIYYCAAWGGAAAFFGWTLGMLIEGDRSTLIGATLKGMALGLFIALGLGLLDALAAGSRRDVASLGVRLSLSLIMGAIGGLLGGFLGQLLYFGGNWTKVVGWTLMGTLIGVAPAAFDYLGAVIRQEERRGYQRKLRNGVIGGTVGGILGGIVLVLFNTTWDNVFRGTDNQDLWSPGATGFVALGACIGLSVAMAQVILREAWVRVETGFRSGRQVLLTRPETVIGRAESCDVGLFGDAAIEKIHARIKRQGSQWYVSDAGTPSGTLVNGQRIAGPTPLHNGDRIQVGGCVLSFAARAKESAVPIPPPPPAPVFP